MIRVLVEAGANVSHTTSLGDSSLHAAAAWGRFPAVEALLDMGADPSAHNMMFVAPLDLAREYNYTDIEQLLLHRGACDIDRTSARWDDMWADLEAAVAAGELGVIPCQKSVLGEIPRFAGVGAIFRVAH
jgi:ankyrin repeat protein